MPHIRALFIEDQGTITLLLAKKTEIRESVARRTGYTIEKVAFIPDMVPDFLANLSDNMLPLEFVIDAGTRCLTPDTHFMCDAIKADLAQIGFGSLNFGVWLRGMADNSYHEHKPG